LKARSRKALTELEPVPRFLEEYRQSVLAAAFRGDLTGEWREGHPDAEPATNELRASPDWQSAKTKLRGAAETVNIIAGRYALSVGPAELDVPGAWPQVRLTDIARLESGHTPSRECPEYWDGDIGWIGIRDAREHHGREIHQTFQRVTQAGLDNSAARLLPAKTVCLSRTASVGYVVVMGKPMATSQDFVNWVCSPAIEPSFLMYLLMAENESLFRFGKGTTHTTIYFPEVKAFHIYLPPVAEQREIVKQIEARLPWMERLMANVHAALTDFDCLDRAILAQAFRGELVEQDPADEPASVLLERIRAERNGTGRPVTAVTAHQAAKLLVVRYLVMLLRTWNAKAARETLETCLVLMLNDDARRAILGKKPAAKAKTKKAATGRTHRPGLDAARFLTPPETVRGKQVFGLGANAPSAADLKSHVRAEDEGRLKETLDALEALGEERSRLELDAVSHATYELVS
jgi:type I restriction enzyme S subunit